MLSSTSTSAMPSLTITSDPSDSNLGSSTRGTHPLMMPTARHAQASMVWLPVLRVMESDRPFIREHFNAMRGAIGFLCVGFVLMQCLCAPALSAEEAVDLVWVRKSERMLYLLEDYRIVRSYPISLGKNPQGHKLKEGDARTPEGIYIIDWRNLESRFHLSLHISYPGYQDSLRAKRAGVDAGGSIMIHGYPATVAGREQSFVRSDWTDGCIALANRHMEEVWRRVADGTPILIDP